MCNLKKAEADWILKIDIVEKGDRLEVNISLLNAFLVILGEFDVLSLCVKLLFSSTIIDYIFIYYFLRICLVVS